MRDRELVAKLEIHPLATPIAAGARFYTAEGEDVGFIEIDALRVLIGEIAELDRPHLDKIFAVTSTRMRR